MNILKNNSIYPRTIGKVISVHGSVIDILFDELLPPIHSLLRAGTENQIAIEVLSQLDAHRVRGIARTPTQGLARGMPVTDTGGAIAGTSWNRSTFAHV